MGNKVYFKLGEQAGVFYDPTLRILISKGDVLEFDSTPKSKKFSQAKAGGHVVVATQDEYEEFLANSGAIPNPEPTGEKEVKADKLDNLTKGKLTSEEVALKKDLEAMESNEDIIEYFKNDGMLEEDIEKLEEKVTGKKATLIKLALDLNRDYK